MCNNWLQCVRHEEGHLVKKAVEFDSVAGARSDVACVRGVLQTIASRLKKNHITYVKHKRIKN